MLICGVKTTHDGGVALIKDGRLIFSIEMEKIANNERYSKIDDLSIVSALLKSHGYALEDVDHLVFDGWHKTHKVRQWAGQEVEIVLAPYRRGLVRDDVLGAYPNQALDLTYQSYTHYAGHLASGYCTSPFASRGEDSFVLAWDGWMFPVLYQVQHATGEARTIGALLPLIGDTYYRLCRHFPPFDKPLEFPHFLGLAGKIMAYIALGEPKVAIIEQLRSWTAEIVLSVTGRSSGWSDSSMDIATGVAILDLLEARVGELVGEPCDIIASIHAWLQQELLDSLRQVIENRPSSNLCIVGGCGLNIKWNSAIRDAGLFAEVYVPPFPNDSGSAIGTAAACMLEKSDHRSLEWDVYSGPALVPTIGAPEGWTSRDCSVQNLAELMHLEDTPVVFLSGRAEVGPRALGHRSILAPASSKAMKDLINGLKGRESYRPVAPICLEEDAPGIFTPGSPDPYMLFDHKVREEWLDKVPAIVHLDGTARLQTVSAEGDEAIRSLLTAYKAVSGLPLLCNTSANYSGSGFFPDALSAMQWGQVAYVWAEGVLFERADNTTTFDKEVAN